MNFLYFDSLLEKKVTQDGMLQPSTSLFHLGMDTPYASIGDYLMQLAADKGMSQMICKEVG